MEVKRMNLDGVARPAVASSAGLQQSVTADRVANAAAFAATFIKAAQVEYCYNCLLKESCEILGPVAGDLSDDDMAWIFLCSEACEENGWSLEEYIEGYLANAPADEAHKEYIARMVRYFCFQSEDGTVIDNALHILSAFHLHPFGGGVPEDYEFKDVSLTPHRDVGPEDVKVAESIMATEGVSSEEFHCYWKESPSYENSRATVVKNGIGTAETWLMSRACAPQYFEGQYTWKDSEVIGIEYEVFTVNGDYPFTVTVPGGKFLKKDEPLLKAYIMGLKKYGVNANIIPGVELSKLLML